MARQATGRDSRWLPRRRGRMSLRRRSKRFDFAGEEAPLRGPPADSGYWPDQHRAAAGIRRVIRHVIKERRAE